MRLYKKPMRLQFSSHLTLGVLFGLIGLIVLFTQLYLPFGFEILVVMGLVFSSRVREFVRETVS
jgi:hypothetical protein